MILSNYNTECNGVIFWDGNSTMPMCTDKCKRRIEELLNNSLGKYLKCCNCDIENETERIQCVRERQNIAVVCDVDFNHVKDCHRDEQLCINEKNTLSKDNAGKEDSDRQGIRIGYS